MTYYLYIRDTLRFRSLATILFGMLWATMVLLSCSDDSTTTSTPTLSIENTEYKRNGIEQGAAGRVLVSTTLPVSALTFEITPTSDYLSGERVLPNIEPDGTIVITATTTAGSYKVTITPDGSAVLGDPITVDFFVTVTPTGIGELDAALKKAISDYGPTGDLNYIDISAVTTMSYLFAPEYTPGATSAEFASTRTYMEDFNGDISKWNVRNVKDFQHMFYRHASFNQDISGWDVSRGTNFTAMFQNATAFNQDISRWTVSSGTTFKNMFSDASVFNQDLSKWGVSSGRDFTAMFQNATAFNQNIGGWDVSQGTHFTAMFKNATVFNNGGSPDIGKWIVSNGTTFQDMFAGAKAFNQNIGEWNVSQATNFNAMFSGATVFNNGGSPDIGKWIVSKGQAFTGMFNTASAFNQNIGGWDVAQGTNFTSMFYRAITFNQDIGGWDVSKGTSFNLMFNKATAFNQDLNRWQVNGTKTGMFTDSGMENNLPSWCTTSC